MLKSKVGYSKVADAYEAGVETARCHNVEELEAVFNKVAVTA